MARVSDRTYRGCRLLSEECGYHNEKWSTDSVIHLVDGLASESHVGMGTPIAPRQAQVKKDVS